MTALTNLAALKQQSGVGFGTSGVRGLVSALTDEVCAGYTQAFIKTLQARFQFDSIAIAIDLRPSSPSLALACANMAKQMGLKVIFCGAIPTPALAFFAQTQAIPGIMVTGSHIPFDRNGLKFYRPDGEISKQDEATMQACTLSPCVFNDTALPSVHQAAYQLYLKRYQTLAGAQGLAGLKLAIYQHSSVGRDLMHALLTSLGAEVICLDRSELFVPIDTEAVSAEDVARGKAWAQKYQIDAIISTDGDGDRPLISDEHGQWLRGDIVGLLTAKALNITHLAVPVSCNTAIESSGFFKKIIRTQIGSPYVIAGMEQLMTNNEADVAGFEANGGFLLGSAPIKFPTLSALPTRDAVLPIIVLLAEIKQSSMPLSQQVAKLPKRFTASDRLQNFPTATSLTLLADWSSQPNKLLQDLGLNATVNRIDLTDGLRLTLSTKQILHLRPSGNAPEFRCYVESEATESSLELLKHIMNLLRKLG